MWSKERVFLEGDKTYSCAGVEFYRDMVDILGERLRRGRRWKTQNIKLKIGGFKD